MAYREPYRAVSILPSSASLLAEQEPQRSASAEWPGRRKEALQAFIGAAVTDGDSVPHTGDGIALHFIGGCVCWDSWWRFSTKDFIEGIKAADADEGITGHLVVIDSPGGEIYGCHEAWQAIRACSKPVYAFCRSMCCSAAYWMASACDRIFAESTLSTVGSIGVMGVLTDYSKMDEMHGIRTVELYAHGSDRKNKLADDAVAGNPDEYITERLDPILSVMLQDIREGRGMKDVEGAPLTGDIYYAVKAEEVSLIDGVRSVGDVLELLAPEVLPRTDLNQLNIF